MKKQITILFLILGISIMVAGCSDKAKDHKEERLTNPNNDVPVP